MTDLKNYALQRDQTCSDSDKQFENNWSDRVSKLLTERKCSCVQWAWKMKALPWCCSSTEAPTPPCGLTRWPVSREQGEYKKTVPTKSYFLKESLPRCCSRIFSYCLLKICKKLAKWSGKTVNFAFWIQKNCIHIYSAYLCIFLFIYLGPPRAKTAGLGVLCMSHSHPSFFSVLWSQMALRPRTLLLPSQLFLLGGNPAQPDSRLQHLLAQILPGMWSISYLWRTERMLGQWLLHPMSS